MSISLNNVNSEVVRAHTRIDELTTNSGVGFPNYAAAQNRSVNTTYTSSEPGYIWMNTDYGDNYRELYLYINDVVYGRYGCDAAFGSVAVLYPVTTGTKYRAAYARGGSGFAIKWIPAIR